MSTKSSILIFYLRLAKNTHKILRMASWIVLTIVLTAGTILTFMNIFQCHPITSAWDIHIKPERCIPLLTEFICSAPVNVTTDLAIMALPIPVITSMRLPPRQKTILVITFALGFFITVVDVVRIYYLQQAITLAPTGASADPDAIFSQSDNFSWNASLSLMWSAVEVNVGITCACIPTLKPLIIRILPAMIVDPKGTRRTSAQVRSAPAASDTGTKPTSSDNSQPDNFITTPADLILPAPPVASADAERRSADELSLREFLSGMDGANAYGARQNGSPLAPRRPRVQSTASTVSDRPFYFGFVNVKKPKSMIRTSALESFKYCTVVSILFFLWGISYGLLNTLNTVVAEVANMTEAQTLGLTSLYFGGGYFFGPLLVGEWLLRHDEHHRSRKRGLGEPQSVGGFKATFIIGLLIYGTGTIMFWPGAVLASYGGFMVSGLVVGFGLAVLETAANPFIVLCGPPEYADTRLLLAQGVQGIGSVLSGLLANNVFFTRIETRDVNSTTLLDVQWTYLAITLFCVLLAFYFYYMPLPEVTDRELERLAARLPVDPHRRLFSNRVSLSTCAIILAVLSQWTYMAAQENMSIFFHDLLTVFAADPSDPSNPRSTYQPPGFPISVLNYLLVAHTAFAVSRFLAGGLAYLSVTYPANRFLPTPRTMLSASVGFSALSVLAAVVMRPTRNPNLIAIPIVSFFLFEGPIWPLVFSLGLRGQGARTKRAAAWLTMGGSGPAFWPFVGYAIVRAGGSIQTSFIVVVALMAVAGGYPLFLTFVPDARKMVDATLVEGEGGEKHTPLERTRSEGAEVTMDQIIEARRRDAERKLNGEGERGLRRLTGTWGRYKERRESGGAGKGGGDGVVQQPQQPQQQGRQEWVPPWESQALDTRILGQD
jgi:fucose permease